MTPQRAVFLDRDGTINENRPDHVKSLDEFTFIPGALQAIRRLAATPVAIIVISNQSVINRGLASADTVAAINQRLAEAVRAQGGRLDGIYICPHAPDEGCRCRKPRPGLLRQAQAEHHLDLHGSYLVGDAVTDVELAQSAGCHPILVLTGRGQAQAARLTPQQRAAVHVASDLDEAVTWILDQEAGRKTGRESE